MSETVTASGEGLGGELAFHVGSDYASSDEDGLELRPLRLVKRSSRTKRNAPPNSPSPPPPPPSPFPASPPPVLQHSKRQRLPTASSREPDSPKPPPRVTKAVHFPVPARKVTVSSVGEPYQSPAPKADTPSKKTVCSKPRVSPSSHHPASAAPDFEEFGVPINGYRLMRTDTSPAVATLPSHRRALYINEVFDHDVYANTYATGFVAEPPPVVPPGAPAGAGTDAAPASVEVYLCRWNEWMASNKTSNQWRFDRMPLPLCSGQAAAVYLESPEAITSEGVRTFFASEENATKLLKQERIKWHPDRWTGHLLGGAPEADRYMALIKHVCQLIVGLVEETT